MENLDRLSQISALLNTSLNQSSQNSNNSEIQSPVIDVNKKIMQNLHKLLDTGRKFEKENKSVSILIVFFF